MSFDWKQLQDPFKLAKVLWPNIRLYNKQVDIVNSVWRDAKTICVAGNMLGKDYISAYIVLLFFLTRNPCKIITTSVDESQLKGVLWGEMRNLINESKIPLDSRHGGPLIVNHLELKKIHTSGPLKGQEYGNTYCYGRVAKKGEGFLGHHANGDDVDKPYTLFVADECSGLDNSNLEKVESWADRILYIGNPYECNNLFYTESEAGDLIDPDSSPEDRRYYRKVIRITGHDSPNVRFGKEEERVYGKATGRMIIKGVLPYKDYKKRLATWDPIRISIGIDAQFYKGSELLLFPPTWLDRSHTLHRELKPKYKSVLHRKARAIGCDPGEGSAETAWAVVDDFGLVEMVSQLTPNTSDISKQTLALMRKYNVPPEMVMFDRGGGGLQIADSMRDNGYHVRTVAFGESVKPLPKRGMTSIEHQIENQEEAYVYSNRRAEMYGHASILMDPSLDGPGFAISENEVELRRQLALMPKKYDKEGRLYLPPKNKKDKDSKEKTLIEILGCSPDRADALVVALYCRDYAPKRVTAGVA